MKIITIFFLLTSFALNAQRKITASPDAGAPPYYVRVYDLSPAYNNLANDLYLAWSDEFNSTSLDNRWRIGWSWGLTYGAGSVWADANQIKFTGNSIKLGVNNKPNTVPDPGNSSNSFYCQYATGVISTKETSGYGYYEVRCKIPYISKHHPAFWMFGGCSQEIDIFEFNGISTPAIQSTNSPPSQDKLGTCIPHVNSWFMPTEVGLANPIMTYHSAKPTGCTFPVGNGRRDLGHTLEYSWWDVKHTASNFSQGCEYQKEIDVDFHNTWHTFGMKFSPEGIFWYIDGICVISEYRFFYNNNGFYFPITDLNNHFQNNPSANVYEQKNLPNDNIKMSIILENYRDPDSWFNGYNLFDFINNWTDWPEGFLEIDYIRVYQFSQCNTNLDFCNYNQLNLYNNSVKAKNITFKSGCIMDLNSQPQPPYTLNLKATEEIRILSEFSTNPNLEFSAQISVCNSNTGKILRTSNNEHMDTLEMLKHYNPTLFEKKAKSPENYIFNPYVNFIVFPSPSKGEFIVKTDNSNEKTLNIISNIGAIVYSTKFNPEQIHLNLNLVSGIYFVEIIADGIKQQKKLVIQ